MSRENESPRRKGRILYDSYLVLLIVLFISSNNWAQIQVTQKPPETRKDNIKEIIHEVEIVDPYQWLENQESSETRAWIDAQNEYTQLIIGNLKGREVLEKRLTELMRVDVINIPQAVNGRYFFTKRLADQDLFVIYMREGLEGKDEVLIDPHEMSPDKTVSVNIQDISKDGKILVYGVRQGGEDEVTIRLFDVDQRKDLPDQLAKARYFGISLKPDNSGFYYTRHGDEGGRVYYHTMSTDPTNDLEIFGEGYGPEKIIFASLSEDGHHLLFHVFHGSSADKSEIYYQNVIEQGSIVTVVNDIDARFFGAVAGDQILVQTNWNAPNKRILAINLKDLPQIPSEWREIIPMGEGVIEGFAPLGGKIFVYYLENVMSIAKIFETDGKHVRDISFPALGSLGGASGHWESIELFYSYSSFHIPSTIYRYDIEKGTQKVWAKINVPIKSENIEVKQVWYESKDGTKIPMFLVHQKEIKLDGTHPTLLTGYGGFNISLTPGFSSTASAWVEYGGVYARPNLRGGGEFGEEWHKAGMLDKKQNVFDDFIAAAEWLIENGYTKPEKLSITGGSNGGLLVGAALTQRPELFKAVACFYPLLDIIRYHKFLVAKFWVPEYGSSEDPEQFKYLYAYSPYHNVKPGMKYPATMFITGDSDTRVAPLHARKMNALLQNATGSTNPVLLLYDTKSGHSGGMPLSKQIEDITNWMSFVMWQLGMINLDRN
ncbi:MAG: S9 family peptidase [Candidatus Marinimicrobia bacterium]|nr:S9 family peptidase [Candidatus Neomarinimicrobiota bacterium]